MYWTLARHITMLILTCSWYRYTRVFTAPRHIGLINWISVYKVHKLFSLTNFCKNLVLFVQVITILLSTNSGTIVTQGTGLRAHDTYGISVLTFNIGGISILVFNTYAVFLLTLLTMWLKYIIKNYACLELLQVPRLRMAYDLAVQRYTRLVHRLEVALIMANRPRPTIQTMNYELTPEQRANFTQEVVNEWEQKREEYRLEANIILRAYHEATEELQQATNELVQEYSHIRTLGPLL